MSNANQSAHANFVNPNDIRQQFALAMSQMYQNEVPLYGDLTTLVKEVNVNELANNPTLKQRLTQTGELERIELERHGAIRLGLPSELSTIARLFAVMGMYPVGYYDLTKAFVPVHSTAFRAINSEDLKVSPFRVFTSLLRLELIEDEMLRQQATKALNNRQIFSNKALELIEIFEQNGGLTSDQAQEFVKEALETFRWHHSAPISKALYDSLHQSHPLIADVVGFKGPHINHLTPRTLNIDAVQMAMLAQNIPAKAIIEGPPKRQCPILLRQTSFGALSENIHFEGDDSDGTHTARFGEIEERGIALTKKGRTLYDDLLTKTRLEFGKKPESDPQGYYDKLQAVFADFVDDYQKMHQEDLAYFYYHKIKHLPHDFDPTTADKNELVKLVNQGILAISPIIYEDFLPVSAAGIFQSNLGITHGNYNSTSNQEVFEEALGSSVYNEMDLYAQIQQASLAALHH